MSAVPPAPDVDLLDRTRAAIDAWAAGAIGITSSITGGGAIRCLEDAMSQRLARPVVSLGSGTAALAACLIGVGVRPGSTVVTSALDWPAASDAIRWVGATPVYADIDPNSLTLDPSSAAHAVRHDTDAIIATHLFGIPADVPAIRAACTRRIPVVEDCAQAIGATLDGRQTGTLGDAAAFSLGPGKQIDAGEGGLAAFAEEASWGRAVVATQHRVRALATTVPVPSVSLPSRLHPLAAVLALPQLATVDARTDAVRIAVYDWLRRHDGLVLAGADASRRPAWWRVPVRRTSSDREGPVIGPGLIPPDSYAPLGLTLPVTDDGRRFPAAEAVLAAYRLVHLPTSVAPARERSTPADATALEDVR